MVEAMGTGAVPELPEWAGLNENQRLLNFIEDSRKKIEKFCLLKMLLGHRFEIFFS